MYTLLEQRSEISTLSYHNVKINIQTNIYKQHRYNLNLKENTTFSWNSLQHQVVVMIFCFIRILEIFKFSVAFKIIFLDVQFYKYACMQLATYINMKWDSILNVEYFVYFENCSKNNAQKLSWTDKNRQTYISLKTIVFIQLSQNIYFRNIYW